MMDFDDPLERQLRRYRPVGPSSELRDRLLARPPVRTVWLIAAAALVLIALVLQMETARVDARISELAGSVREPPTTLLEAAEEARRLARLRETILASRGGNIP